MAANHRPLVRDAPDFANALLTASARAVGGARALRSAALLMSDLLALVIAVAAGEFGAVQLTAKLWPHPAVLEVRMGVLMFAPMIAAVIACLASRGHYERRIPYWRELRDIIGACAAGLLAACLVTVALHMDVSRLLLLIPVPLTLIAIVAMRRLTRRALVAARIWNLPVVVVGSGRSVALASHALMSERDMGFDIVAVVSPARVKVGAGDVWARLLRHHSAEMVVLAFDHDGALRSQDVEALVRERVPFAVMPQLGGLPVFGCEPTPFVSHDTVLFSYRHNLARPLARFTKAVFDISAAFAALVVLAPLLLLVALLVKRDGGPVLFAHPRIGAGGRTFKCLKFRSMVVNSDAVLHAHLRADPIARAEWLEKHKLTDDPRVTWIGRFLRKTSLDELPQLLNVLRLEMSLVGPRPIVETEVARYDENIAYYYETRPGITGLWQVSGRSETSYDQRVHLDSWYVKNWSLWQDFAIVARTIPAVLKRRGAV